MGIGPIIAILQTKCWQFVLHIPPIWRFHAQVLVRLAGGDCVESAGLIE